MSNKDYFKELGLSHDASADDVRSAYKTLAKQWHPDKNQNDDAEEKFKSILEAYTYLKSDDRREMLARELKKPQGENIKQNHTNPQGKNRPQSSTYEKPNQAHQDSTDSTHFNKTNKRPTSKEKFSRRKSARETTHNYSTFTAHQEQKPRRPARNANIHVFMKNFMGFSSFADPFDEIIFDIFMVSPSRPEPKSKPKVDPFGNKLPDNLDPNLYDWKSATKTPGAQPDYKEYLDHETEFTCHYCGLMMSMDMLRKHEPKCLRLGGRRAASAYSFEDEEINEAYHGSGSPNKPQKIKCKWCGESFSKKIAASHISRCKLFQNEPKKKQPGPRPEWNNNFTETEYPEDPPQDVLFGKQPVNTRQKHSRISVDDFNPFGQRSPDGRRKCWKCRLEYGSDSPVICAHYA